MPVDPISVIIVNFNAGRYLQRCLDSLAAQDFRDFEALIVDNGSDDGSLEALALPDERFRVIALGRNAGFAQANNVGAIQARHPWIATLNPDAFPHPGWLAELAAAARRYPFAAMFDSTLLMDHDPGLLDGTGDCLSPFGFPWRSQHGQPVGLMPGDYQVFSPCAAAAMYRRDLFEAAGGFDERFFCYCEDVDLAFRMRLLGGVCIHLEGARVNHVGGGITSAYSDFSLFHGHRNSLWMNIKNMPFPLIAAALPAHLLAELLYGLFLALAYLPGGGKSGAHRGRNPFTVLKAVWQGLRQSGPFWRERAALQKNRKISAWALAKSLCWSPGKFLRRQGCHRKIEAPKV